MLPSGFLLLTLLPPEKMIIHPNFLFLLSKSILSPMSKHFLYSQENSFV